jgi:N-formylmaleamate deformylase
MQIDDTEGFLAIVEDILAPPRSQQADLSTHR